MRVTFMRRRLCARTYRRLDFYALRLLGARGKKFFFQKIIFLSKKNFLQKVFFKKKNFFQKKFFFQKKVNFSEKKFFLKNLFLSIKKRFSSQKNFFLPNDSLFSNKRFFEKKNFFPQKSFTLTKMLIFSKLFIRGGVLENVLEVLGLGILKSLALASRPQVLENWPVLGSRTALFFKLLKFCEALEKFFGKRFLWRSLEKFLWRPFFFFFFWRALALVSLVLGLGLEHSCPWPRECLSSERLSLALASDFFCVLGLGLEPCVLDSTSAFYLMFVKKNRQNRKRRKRSGYRKKPSSDWLEKDCWESVICVTVQPLSCRGIFLSAEGGVRTFDESDFRSK